MAAKLAGLAVPRRGAWTVVTRAWGNGRLTTTAETLAAEFDIGVLIVVHVGKVLEIAKVAVDSVLGAQHLMRAPMWSVWALTEADGVLAEGPKTADGGKAPFIGEAVIGRVGRPDGVGDHIARAWPPRWRSTNWGWDGRRGRRRGGNGSRNATLGLVIVALPAHVEGHVTANHMDAGTLDK